MYRLSGERIALDLDGPTVEVERIHSDLIQFEGYSLWAAFVAAETPETNYRALLPLFDYFVREALPQWDIADHLGQVPTTPRGMVRLGTELSLGIIAQWLGTLPAADAGVTADEPNGDPPSAVDAVNLPEPVKRQIKRRLAAVA